MEQQGQWVQVAFKDLRVQQEVQAHQGQQAQMEHQDKLVQLEQLGHKDLLVPVVQLVQLVQLEPQGHLVRRALWEVPEELEAQVPQEPRDSLDSREQLV